MVIDIDTDTDTETDADTDNGITDPDAASGSMMVTYTGNANTRNARPHVAMNKTEVGFKALRGFILRTFFNKLKQFEAKVDYVVLVKGTAYSKKTGKMSQHVISAGNTDYAQSKAQEYMRNFLLWVGQIASDRYAEPRRARSDVADHARRRSVRDG